MKFSNLLQNVQMFFFQNQQIPTEESIKCKVKMNKL